MKKKWIIITLVDGEIIKRELNIQQLPALFGKPATDQAFTDLCTTIGMYGTLRQETVSKDYVEYIPPSQIKKVEVKFEK